MGIRKIDLGVVCIIGVTNPEREGGVYCGNWKEEEMQQGQWECNLRWCAGCVCPAFRGPATGLPKQLSPLRFHQQCVSALGFPSSCQHFTAKQVMLKQSE